jgi:thiol-disulfide isomerase/thioredoxin
MAVRIIFPALVAALALVPSGAARPAEAKPVAAFSLTDADGKKWAVADQKAKFTVVAFLALECPMSNGYLPVLGEVAAKYADKGVSVVGVFPDPDTTAAQAAAHAKEYKVPFPVFADCEQVSVPALGPKVTPEVVILDEKQVVRYRGRIDDGFAARLKPRAAVTRHDLVAALDELLAGKAVSEPETKALGCPISVAEVKPAASGNAVRFYKDVLPVLQSHCQSCHRPGQAGPFSLLTYKQATKWADLCVEEVAAKRMPPWKPAPNALLAGERSLPPAAAKVLEQWVAQGMPEGDPKDAPSPVKFDDNWTLGEPDMILEAPSDVTIAAKGPDHFRVLVFPTNLTEDKDVVAVEVRPGNPKVVHHTVNLIDRTGTARKLQAKAAEKADPADADRGPGYAVKMGFGFVPDRSGILGGWAPGMLPKMLPDGVAIRLPKGSDIAIQIHYHRTGKEETDRTRVGLYFAKKPAKERFSSLPVAGLFWAIPAGQKEYIVDRSWRTTEDATVYRLIPHMHLLGKDIELFATLPGEKERSLIRIPVWDYNWQEQYDLKEPLRLPQGTVLRVRATFDNSAENPNNPSFPPKVVRLGEQTTDEMCFVFLGVSSAGFPQALIPTGKW